MKPRSALGLLLVLALTACSPSRTETPKPTPQPTPAPPPVQSPPSQPTWARIDVTGPSPRQDHSLSADQQGRVFLFGGRAAGKPLDDLWIFESTGPRWKKIEAKGPSARFAHNAGVVDGKLLVFGGQAGGSTFFNDVWSFDPSGETWSRLDPDGPVPIKRYGAGGTVADGAFIVSHGFNFDGRFDDTWALQKDWTDVSPAPSTRPVKRCLHRISPVGERGILLFGGQTTGKSFLGDTWIYENKKWSELKIPGPSPRNLFALASKDGRAYLFGGRDSGGAKNDLWAFDGSSWTQVQASAEAPEPRSGIEATVTGGKMFLFGGNGKEGELNDLWELTLP